MGPSGRKATEERRIEAVIDFVHRRRWAIVLTLLVVLAAAAAYAQWRPLTYAAQSIVLVDLDPNASPRPEVGGAQVTDDLFATNDRSLAAELFLIRTSSEIRSLVAEQLGPSATASAGAGVNFGVADAAANALVINVTSADPEAAATVANAYAEAYVQVTRNATNQRLAGELAMLEDREATRRAELQHVQGRQRALGYQSGAAAPSAQEGSLVAAQIASLEMQRDQARTEIQTQQAMLQATLASLSDLEPRLAQRIADGEEGRLNSLRSELAALYTERDQTEQRYPNIATRDARVVARLDAIEREIFRKKAEADGLSERIVSGGLSGGGGEGAANLAYAANLRREAQAQRVAIQASDTQARRIDARIAQQYERLQRLPTASAQLARQQIEQAHLDQGRLNTEQAHLTAAGYLQALRDQMRGATGYARVIQPAYPPRQPAGLKPRYILLLGLFVGLSLGLVLAFVQDKMNNRYYKPEQLAGLGYPVLVTIPDTRELQGPRRNARKRGHPTGGLAALTHPFSPAAETYRRLRTNVFRLGSERPQVILVTSPGVGDGKSTTAANLAVTLARGGLRTALVDADLRRPTLHEVFGVSRTPGLTEALSRLGLAGDGAAEPAMLAADAGSARPEASPRPVDVGVEGLELIPAGGGKDVDEAPALSSPSVGAYLREIRKHFDVIVVDTPPTLATSDAADLAQECDAVLVTVRAGQTREGELALMLETLALAGAPVSGFILNGFKVASAYSYKYKYRGYTRNGFYPGYGAPRDQPAPTSPLLP